MSENLTPTTQTGKDKSHVMYYGAGGWTIDGQCFYSTERDLIGSLGENYILATYEMKEDKSGFERRLAEHPTLDEALAAYHATYFRHLPVIYRPDGKIVRRKGYRQ